MTGRKQLQRFSVWILNIELLNEIHLTRLSLLVFLVHSYIIRVGLLCINLTLDGHICELHAAVPAPCSVLCSMDKPPTSFLLTEVPRAAEFLPHIPPAPPQHPGYVAIKLHLHPHHGTGEHRNEVLPVSKRGEEGQGLPLHHTELPQGWDGHSTAATTVVVAESEQPGLVLPVPRLDGDDGGLSLVVDVLEVASKDFVSLVSRDGPYQEGRQGRRGQTVLADLVQT